MKEEGMTILEWNTEVIKQIRVNQKYGIATIRATDLRELLFRISNDSEITISTGLLYHFLIEHGILIKGFKPEKTLLRHKYKLSIERINELLPGAFKGTKPGPSRK